MVFIFVLEIMSERRSYLPIGEASIAFVMSFDSIYSLNEMLEGLSTPGKDKIPLLKSFVFMLSHFDI